MKTKTVILVADDDPTVRNYARLVLENEGYTVLTASDGEEALSISRQFPEEIQCLLSDMDMPKLGGPELRQRMLMERPELRVILMSASSEPADGIEFVWKPLERIELIQRIRGVLSKSA